MVFCFSLQATVKRASCIVATLDGKYVILTCIQRECYTQETILFSSRDLINFPPVC